MQSVAAQVSEGWSRMGFGQKVLSVLVGTAVLGVLGFFVTAGTKPSYETAFANLAEEDAAAVVAKLREAGVPFQLLNNGKTIQVPAERVPDVRLQMAGDGVLGAGQTGFELFNQTNFGMTESVQRINYQRALEGELARTIKRLDAVQDARVHIVLPQSSLFSEKKSDATASVVIAPKAGRRVDQAQIQGITNLVVGSVEGLKPDNLSIVDTKGVLLSSAVRGAGSASPQLTATQYQQQQKFEGDLSQQLRTMLERVVGPGKVAVTVAAALDWNQVETQREVFEPGGGQPGAVRSSRTQSEVSTNVSAAGGEGGIPGTASNVPTYQTSNGQTGTTGFSRNETLTNFEVNKTVERVVRAPGAVQRLNVAVVLDEKALPADVTTDQIQAIIATAAGINANRGDSVTVTRMPFNTAQTDAALAEFEAAQQTEFITTIARTAGLILLPLILLFLLWMFLRRSFKPVALQAAMPGLPTVQTIYNELPAGASAPALNSAGRPAAPPLNLEEDPQSLLVRQQIAGLARTEPAMVSALINSWIEEDRQR